MYRCRMWPIAKACNSRDNENEGEHECENRTKMLYPIKVAPRGNQNAVRHGANCITVSLSKWKIDKTT